MWLFCSTYLCIIVLEIQETDIVHHSNAIHLPNTRSTHFADAQFSPIQNTNASHMPIIDNRSTHLSDTETSPAHLARRSHSLIPTYQNISANHPALPNAGINNALLITDRPSYPQTEHHVPCTSSQTAPRYSFSSQVVHVETELVDPSHSSLPMASPADLHSSQSDLSDLEKQMLHFDLIRQQMLLHQQQQLAMLMREQQTQQQLLFQDQLAIQQHATPGMLCDMGILSADTYHMASPKFDDLSKCRSSETIVKYFVSGITSPLRSNTTINVPSPNQPMDLR